MKIYKYFSSDVLELVFQRQESCGVRCSLPKDYNDPYELFLGVDLSIESDFLATYREIVQEIPQFPTTCFSKSPIVAPMWAHYGQNHSGFVVEFDVESLREHFDQLQIGDVRYKIEPSHDLAEAVARAAVTMKPRHAVWLQKAVFFEAYFSKYQDWSYEQECRLVDVGGQAERIGHHDILFIPFVCVTAIIVGSKFPETKRPFVEKMAVDHGIDIYQLRIGRSFPAPYMLSADQRAFVFSDGAISAASSECGSCSEPVKSGASMCPWCSITDDQMEYAARINPFRILERHGLLEDYFLNVGSIESLKKK